MDRYYEFCLLVSVTGSYQARRGRILYSSRQADSDRNVDERRIPASHGRRHRTIDIKPSWQASHRKHSFSAL